MPFYYQIKENPAEAGIAERLLKLRKALSAEIPQRTVSDNLLLATWNIRDFDSSRYGAREKESYYYIAEIISSFDIVAVQEVHRDLRALKRLMSILGSWWDFIVTDATEGGRGNSERMAYIFDTRKVTFGGLATQVVIPPISEKVKVEGKEKATTIYHPSQQLARTPFMAGFQSGWFKFVLTTVHIYYGGDVAEHPVRVREIELLSEFLAKRARDKTAWANNLIMLGDFNIFKPEDITMQAIEKTGFFVPPELKTLPANVAQNKYYDQMAFYSADVDYKQKFNAGVFNFFKHVFKDNEEEYYIDAMGKGYYYNKEGEKKDSGSQRRHYKTWRTHQISDHLPMWIELKTDFGDEYLRKKMNEGRKA